MTIRAHWRGNPADETEHHYGIPARSLDEDDWEQLDTEQRETVRKSPLYRYVTRSRRATDSGDSPEEETEPDAPATDEPADAAEEGKG